MRSILAITGTRSDWGLMLPVYNRIRDVEGLEMSCVLTGMHFLPRFAASRAAVESECPGPIYPLPCDSLTIGSNAAMTRAFGHAVAGMTDIMEMVSPDILLVQGDRGEMLAGAIAAVHLNIPIVHMSGGDLSGTIDDSIRHAISTFSHIHLTTCEASSNVLKDRGESPGRILVVGEPGIDRIHAMEYMSRAELCRLLHLSEALSIILVAQHSVTTESSDSGEQMRATLDAVATFVESGNAQAVISAANSDAGGEAMNAVIGEFVSRQGFCFRASFGSELFLNLLRNASVLVGNSSSGIWEAPSFGLPVVNIGTRQHRRLRAGNVLDVPTHDAALVAEGIRTALYDPAFRARARECINPYGDGRAAERTVAVLEGLDLSRPHLVAKWLDSGEDYLGFSRAIAFK